MQWSLLIISLKYSRVYMSIPNFQSLFLSQIPFLCVCVIEMKAVDNSVLGYQASKSISELQQK